jgi:glycosyltransferase involved in cell wall biosynthesis
MVDRKQTPTILHLDSSHAWGGGQNQIRLLMRELAETGVRQLCLTPHGSPLAQRLQAEHLPVRSIKWQGGSDPRAAWQVLQTLRDYDIVHCHDAHALQIALLPARVLGKKVVAARRVPFQTSALKWNLAHVVIAVSEHVRQSLLRDGVHAHRIRVIHSGTDQAETDSVEPFSPTMRVRHNVPATAFVVVSAALLVEMKGQLIIPAAAALLPDAHWFIAGEGPLRPQIEAAIARHDVADRVHMLGWLPDARPLFREADAYLSASTEDGLGNSITESLAMHLPVISADGGGGAEIVRPVHDRTRAVLYEAGNPQSLAGVITRLRDPALRAQVVAAQDARFPDFDIRRTAAQTLAVYHELMRD